MNKTQKIIGLKSLRILAVVFATIIMLLCLGVSDADATIKNSGIEKHSQKEIVAYAQKHPTGPICFDMNGNPISGEKHKTEYIIEPNLESPYELGMLSDSETVSALNTIKLIRYIAGISDNIYLSDEYNFQAQAACLVNYANGSLSHSPYSPGGMSESLANLGKGGASHSNLARTDWQNNTLKWSIINGWMDDSDPSNIKVLGHRRWILNPALGSTGFGSVSGTKGTFNAMYSHDSSNMDKDKSCVHWPAYNMPTSFFSAQSPWSISIGEAIDPSKVIVSIVRSGDYKVWTFCSSSSDGDFYVQNDGYGQPGCIIFRPAGIKEYKAGDRYFVYITGIKKDVSYEVNFFDMEKFYSPSAPVISKLSLNSEGKPHLEWKKVVNSNGYDLYRKPAGGSWRLLLDDLDETCFEDISAGKGIKYYYRIVAKREVCNTTYKSNASLSKSIITGLNRPYIYSVKSTGRGVNTVKWKYVSKATSYRIYRRVLGSKKWQFARATLNPYYKDSGVRSGVVYEYRVKACRKFLNNLVYSNYSKYKKVRTK